MWCRGPHLWTPHLEVNKMSKMMRIDWQRDSELVHLTHKEFNEAVDWYKANGKLVLESKTRMLDWLEEGSYRIDDCYKNQPTIFAVRGGRFVRLTSSFDEEKNERRNQKKKGGTFAFNAINKMMKEKYDLSLISAFGRVDKSFKQLVPAPLLWQNQDYKCDIVHKAYKADVSSAFPYMATLPLPDAHKKSVKHISGRVAPNEEYPFAFYPKSKNIAILGELDTHDYVGYHIHDERSVYQEISPDLDDTILMKASPYTLKDIMQELYDGRKDNPDNKIIMNSFLGYLQSTKLWKGDTNMAHITAVVITRSNHRMLKYTEDIINKEGTVFMVMTDSIVWNGNQFKDTQREKALGNFVLEYEKVDVAYCKYGQYAIADPKTKELLLVKHQGLDENAYREKIAGVRNLRDFVKHFSGVMAQAVYDPVENKFVTRDRI